MPLGKRGESRPVCPVPPATPSPYARFWHSGESRSMGHLGGNTRLDRYAAVRNHTERLAATLSPEDQCVQSMPDASPAKWHRAHTTWFFEQFVLVPRLRGYRPFDPAYAYLFNSYYETVGARHPRPARGLITRPAAAEIGRYRAHVDAAMQR